MEEKEEAEGAMIGDRVTPLLLPNVFADMASLHPATHTHVDAEKEIESTCVCVCV